MILFDHVSYMIKDKMILDDVHLMINEGEKVLIEGNSGSGKSTLFQLLLHNLKPTRGHIFYEKKDICAFSSKELTQYRREKIAIILQKDDLYPTLSVLDNLLLFYPYKRIEAYLKKARLFHLKDQKVELLSGGERQRIAILKSCLKDFDLLLCDEITSALDLRAGKEIVEFILSLFKDKTILFISHTPELFETWIQRRITLEKGKIVQDQIYFTNRAKKQKVKMNKNKFPVWAIIIKKAGKKCSILQCVLFLVASFCFSFVFSFSSFFEFLAAKSYQTYFDYNVFEVKEHPSWKEDQKEFFFGISSFIMDSRIYLDDIHYSFLQLKPHFWEDKPRFVINTLLLKRLNQDKINTIVMYYKQEKKIEHTIGVVKEEQMFSSPTLYYYYPYFQNIIASKDEKELLYVCNTIDVTDKRFSVYPLYEKRSSTLPYLYNNAIKDYLTYHLIFDSLSTIVYGYFLLIMGYFMISSCLLMISLIYKDVRDLAILLNRGYTNWNLICIYSLPILLYSLLSLLLLFIDFSFLRGILISCLLQIISLLISFNYLKRKSLHELLKEDFLC